MKFPFLKSFVPFRLTDQGVKWARSLNDNSHGVAPISPIGSFEKVNAGFVPPLPNESSLVYRHNDNVLLTIRIERKSVPGSLVKQELEKRCQEFFEKEGYRPGRALRKELKEEITDTLLTKAMVVAKDYRVVILPERRLMLVEGSSQTVQSTAFALLLGTTDGNASACFAGALTNTVPALSEWLLDHESPSGKFTVDRDAVLKENGVNGATIRYVNHELNCDEVRDHLNNSMSCVKLALTWNDRISFSVTSNGVFTGVKPLDILNDSLKAISEMEEAVRFENDFALFCLEAGAMVDCFIDDINGGPVTYEDDDL